MCQSRLSPVKVTGRVLLRERQVSASASQNTWDQIRQSCEVLTDSARMLYWGSNLHIKKVKNPLVVKSKDSLENQHVGRVDGGGLLQSCVLWKGVYWNLGPLSKHHRISHANKCPGLGSENGLCR